MIKDLVLPKELQELLKNLRALKAHLDLAIRRGYDGRVNPFNENLFDWSEKGARYGDDITIYDSTTIHGEVRIGDHVWVGPFCTLDGSGGLLSIGKGTVISSSARLLTHSTAMHVATEGKASVGRGWVRIGAHTFIGVGAVVLPGVTIGSHSIVGANAVVTKDVPDWTIVAGVPAKKIGDVEL